MKKFNQKQLAKETGIPYSTITYWTRTSKIVADVEENGKKYFSEKVLAEVLNLKAERKTSQTATKENPILDSAKVVIAETDGSEEDNDFDNVWKLIPDVTKLINDDDDDDELVDPPVVDKKIIATDGEKNSDCITHEDNSTVGKSSQCLDNLPDEILSQPRFFELYGMKKEDTPKGWSNPNNQRFFSELDSNRLLGFDTCGHDRAVNYALLDFDHCLNDDGEFISEDAERWYNFIALQAENTYCEKSISGRGLHFLIKPSPDKFKPICNGENGVLYFDEEKDIKLEIFFKNKSRYCLLTGNVFNCEPKTPIIDGDIADDILQTILNEIAKRNSVEDKKQSDSKRHSSDTQEYDLFRAEIMLDTINPADLSDSDWLAVVSSCKNTGVPYSVVDTFNQRDSQRYNAEENLKRWDSLNDPSFTIETLHGIAKRFDYSERDARRQWYQLHPELKPSAKRVMDDKIKQELDDAIIWLDTLTPENLLAKDIYDNLHFVSLAQAFGYIPKVENFFNVIKTAKKDAGNRLADSKAELTAPVSDTESKEIQALLNVNIKILRKAIDDESKTLKHEHEHFIKQRNATKARERARFKAEERRVIIEDNTNALIELQKEYRKNPSRELALKMQSLIINLCEWRYDKCLNPVAVKGTAANAELFFKYDPYIDGLFAYDEFQQADVFLKASPWKYEQGTPLDKQPCIGAEWRDSDDAELMLYLRNTYTEFNNNQLVFQEITHWSQKRSFHPVKQHFKNLPTWDGIKRAAEFFIKFLRVEDSEYAREVTLNWLIAAVARIFNPGCRYQTALVLKGNQGIGKSYCIERLGGKWYSDISDRVDDPHAADAIKIIWLGEFKEMAGMRKAEKNAIKAFIERSFDTRRFAYERRPAMILRHCVFAITVNDEEFLTDTTGNRRYMILHCNSKQGDFVEGLTDDYIQQVWAEVYALYQEMFKDGFDEKKLRLSKAAQIKAEEIAEQHVKDDGMKGEIEAFVDRPILPPFMWNLLSKEERYLYFKNGGFIELLDAISDLNRRRRNRGGRESLIDADIDSIEKFFRNTSTFRTSKVTIGGETHEKYYIYGATLREHVSAAEICTECFNNNSRNFMQRIHEVLSSSDSWKIGERISRDPIYGDQKKVFYRISRD